MLLLLLSMLLAAAGPVEDAQAALAAHARGRDVRPLKQAASDLMQAQGEGAAPTDGPTWELVASIHLAVAQDGPLADRAVALRAAVDAVERAHQAGGAPELTDTITGVALLLTNALRRARTDEERTSSSELGERLFTLSEAVQPPPPATVRGQLAQALAPLVLPRDASAAAVLAERAAALGHPSKSVDLAVSQALVHHGAPADALAFTRAALARWPDAWELDDFAGGTCARMRRFADAVAHFDAALEHIHPELTRQRAVLLRKRAAARTETGDLDGAIADFEAAQPLARAEPTQRYQWGRTHVLAAQRITQDVRTASGNKAALPKRAQAHCEKAVPHLQAVERDARLGAPATQALTLCRTVIAAEATGE